MAVADIVMDTGKAPGMVKTDFIQASWSDPTRLAQLETTIPSGRAADVDDNIGAALFLAFNASGYITGHTVVADVGGLS